MNSIEEVKARLDIVEVISQYVQLQKAGRSFKAICPFHSERTPSFFVSPERQSWHCFGACNSGGDVFSFVMKREGLDFGQSLRLLAEKAGVALPERRQEAEEGQGERLRQANEAAAHYFHQLLHSEAAQGAQQYLAGRGIDAKAIQEWLLGYAPPQWETLRQHLGERGFGDEELLAAGLLVEGEARPYDRFRGRLMFPIRDVKGRVIGFGARALDDSLPKYLNTPQTAIFDKGSTLYALDRARDGIRREGRAVIVEGYMDAIAAHQHGFNNVVASMGTALSERQVRLLKRYSRNIVLALDADAAGREAALRAHQVVTEALRQAGEQEPIRTWRDLVSYQEAVAVDLRIAELPGGRDPDDVIRADPPEWQRRVAEAKPVLDYKFEAVASRTDRRDPRQRQQAVDELLPLVGPVKQIAMRGHYLQWLERITGVEERLLQATLAKLASRSGDRGPASKSDVLAPAFRPDQREEFLLALLLRYPSLRERGLALDESLLWQAENREVMAAWRKASDIEGLRQALATELQEHLDRLLARRLPAFAEDQAATALEDCLRRLQRRQLEAEKQATMAALAAREEAVGPTPLAEAATTLWQGGQVPATADEQLAEAAGLHLRDLEAGLRLHTRDKAVPEGQEEKVSAENVEVKTE